MNKDIVDRLFLIVTIAAMCMLCYSLENTRKERDKYYKTTCILSDCIHNMIDNYGDEDDIYNNYINIAYEETGVKEQEFINYSYCY